MYDDKKAFRKILFMAISKRLTTLAASVLVALFPSLATAQSQIMPYTQGSPQHRPTLLSSEAGVAVVNIQSANDKGVSLNQFSRFNIDDKGVVLNNARFSTDSVLAGQIAGNFWLLGGEAKTIIGEVYDKDPTVLGGKIEVAGQSANVIIANPSGLVINGGGFINANNSILTTGRVLYHEGVPTAVRVDGGAVSVHTQGLSYVNDLHNRPNFAQIFSETLDIHGRILGGDDTVLQAVTGENTISLTPALNATDINPATNLSKSPNQADNKALSIDISRLGQVYADGIYLVSTKEGLGVRQAGALTANHAIHLQADGKIAHAGSTSVVHDEGQILLKTNKDDIANTGSVHSQGELLVVSARDIRQEDASSHPAVLLGEKSTTLVAGGDIEFQNLRYDRTKSALDFFAQGDIKSQTPLYMDTQGELTLKAMGNLELDEAYLKSPSLTVSADELVLRETQLSAGEKLHLSGGQLDATNTHILADAQAGEVSVVAGGAVLADTQVQAGRLMLATQEDLRIKDSVFSTNTAAFSSAKDIHANQSAIHAKTLGIAAQAVDLSGQVIDVEQGVIYGVERVDMAASQLAGRQLQLRVGALTITHSDVSTQDSLSLYSDTQTTLKETQVTADKHISIKSQEGDVNLENEAASVLAKGLVFVEAGNEIDLNQSQITAGAIALQSHNAGVNWQEATLNTQKQATLAEDAALAAVDGSLVISSHADMHIDAGKQINVSGDFELHSAGRLALEGDGQKTAQVYSGGQVYFRASDITLTGAYIAAADGIRAYATAGDVSVLATKTDIAPTVDAERVTAIRRELGELEAVINTLEADVPYQETLKAIHAQEQMLAHLEVEFKRIVSPSAADIQAFDDAKKAEVSKLNHLRQALTQRQTLLGVKKDLDDLTQDRLSLNTRLKIAETPFLGYENQGTVLESGGEIALAAAQNLVLQNATLSTKDAVTLQAFGVGDVERVIGKDEDGNPIYQPFAVAIEGLYDVYQRGQESDDGFSLINDYKPTVITADKGIFVQVLGQNAQNHTATTQEDTAANVLLVGGEYTANAGGIHIQSLGSVVLQAGQDSLYDRETQSITRGSIRRRTTITTTTEQLEAADVVKLNAKDIHIQAGGDIHAYATDFNAHQDTSQSATIKLQAGDGIRLLAVSELHEKEVDVQKTSRFLGIRYNSTQSHNRSQEIQELPSRLVADFTHAQSGADTVLQGTYFSSLQNALIEAGVGDKAVQDARIILSTISTAVSEEQSRQFNNLVWQSIAGQGGLTEDRRLPVFQGAMPTLSATGGIHVQVPIDKEDLDHKDHLVYVLERLSTEPGFGYLDTLISRDDVDFSPIRLAHEQWDYKEEGLTPAAAALIAAAVTIATGVGGLTQAGVGATLTGSAGTGAGTLANAAFSSLISRATVSLINNQGDIKQTLNELGSSDNIKQITQAVLTAGIAQGLDHYLSQAFSATSTLQNAQAVQASLSENLIRGIVQGTGSALTQNLLYGTELTEALKGSLTAALVNTATANLYQNGIKPIDQNTLINNLAHKLAAGLTGCLSASLKDQSCEAAAVGAIIGEMVGDFLVTDAIQFQIDLGVLPEQDRQDIINTASLTAGAIALLYEFDVTTAMESAREAVENNAVVSRRYGNEYNVSRSEIARHAPNSLGDNYYARVDSNSPVLEVHVYKYEGGKLREIAVYQEGMGYIKKHGITMDEPEYPRGIANKVKALQVEALRAKYPNDFQKGRFNIRVFNSGNVFKATRFLGIGGAVSTYNSHHQACLIATDPSIINTVCNFE